jgi:hypothetical protein
VVADSWSRCQRAAGWLHGVAIMPIGAGDGCLHRPPRKCIGAHPVSARATIRGDDGGEVSRPIRAKRRGHHAGRIPSSLATDRKLPHPGLGDAGLGGGDGALLPESRRCQRDRRLDRAQSKVGSRTENTGSSFAGQAARRGAPIAMESRPPERSFRKPVLHALAVMERWPALSARIIARMAACGAPVEHDAPPGSGPPARGLGTRC